MWVPIDRSSCEGLIRLSIELGGPGDGRKTHVVPRRLSRAASTSATLLTLPASLSIQVLVSSCSAAALPPAARNELPARIFVQTIGTWHVLLLSPRCRPPPPNCRESFTGRYVELALMRPLVTDIAGLTAAFGRSGSPAQRARDASRHRSRPPLLRDCRRSHPVIKRPRLGWRSSSARHASSSFFSHYCRRTSGWKRVTPRSA